MAVALTISETLLGSAVNDSLAGGGNGVDYLSVTNGQYAPLADQGSNTGAKTLYIRHDAVTNPITDVKTFIADYNLSTGFTYGGAKTSATDYQDLLNEGNTSGDSKNNINGLSGGLWIDMDADASTTNQFDQANFPSLVKIYGDNGGFASGDGRDLASGFTMAADAMVADNTGEVLATSPVAGQIGKEDDLVLGEAAKVKLRIYLREAFPDGGIVQWGWVVAYAATS